jgi:hypothetical protein
MSAMFASLQPKRAQASRAHSLKQNCSGTNPADSSSPLSYQPRRQKSTDANDACLNSTDLKGPNFTRTPENSPKLDS